MSSNLSENLSRDLFILEDENNPKTSQMSMIYPKTIIDQVFDQESPTKKNLRELLADLKQEIVTGGMGNIIFPVTSVNGDTDDVVITPAKIGLGRVDNTSDLDKPLSGPQRNSIMDILKNYNFHVNLDSVYSHMSDNNNPHSVNVEQINVDDQLTNFVNRLITAHSLSQERTVHLDIRNSLSKLWNYVDQNINQGIDGKIENILGIVTSHIEDPSAHSKLFKEKEDISNKAVGFTDTTSDHRKYPSTKAVVDYIGQSLRTFKNTLPDITDYIVDIKVIDDRSKLPAANNASAGKAYLIRTGDGSQNEIAVCRMNPDQTYSWDISPIGSISKFNPAHFEDSIDGYSIKMSAIIDSILTQTGDIDSTVSNILKDYYTKDEVENRFIRSIKIIPGTMDGHIRYYINDDMLTMSDDIPIPGLKNLAFLEYVTEKEIRELAVLNRHLANRSVDSRVLGLKSVKREHIDDMIYTIDMLKTEKGTLLGNLYNDDGTVHPVNLTQLGDLLRPIIGGWADINIPGVNSPLLEVSPNVWEPNAEMTFFDGSHGMRFTGTISAIPNSPTVTALSTLINTTKYQILDAGGWWRTDSDAQIDGLIGGTNVFGNTFAEMRMTKFQLELSTISIGNRVDAQYDVWVRYIPRTS